MTVKSIFNHSWAQTIVALVTIVITLVGIAIAMEHRVTTIEERERQDRKDIDRIIVVMDVAAKTQDVAAKTQAETAALLKYFVDLHKAEAAATAIAKAHK